MPTALTQVNVTARGSVSSWFLGRRFYLPVTNAEIADILERIAARTSPGLARLLGVPGLGLKRVHILHTTLGIDDLDKLAAAAKSGRL